MEKPINLEWVKVSNGTNVVLFTLNPTDTIQIDHIFLDYGYSIREIEPNILYELWGYGSYIAIGSKNYCQVAALLHCVGLPIYPEPGK